MYRYLKNCLHLQLQGSSSNRLLSWSCNILMFSDKITQKDVAIISIFYFDSNSLYLSRSKYPGHLHWKVRPPEPTRNICSILQCGIKYSNYRNENRKWDKKSINLEKETSKYVWPLSGPSKANMFGHRFVLPFWIFFPAFELCGRTFCQLRGQCNKDDFKLWPRITCVYPQVFPQVVALKETFITLLARIFLHAYKGTKGQIKKNDKLFIYKKLKTVTWQSKARLSSGLQLILVLLQRESKGLQNKTSLYFL